MHGLYKKVVQTSIGKDLLLTFGVQVLLMGGVFAINKILSIRLGVEGFGEFNIIKRTATVLAYVMIGGMGIALPRYLSVYRVQNMVIKEKIFFTSTLLIVFCLSFAVAILAIIFKQSILKFIFGNIPQQDYFLPLLLYAFSLCISTCLFQFFRGKGNFVKSSLTQLLAQMLLLAGCFFTFVSLSFVFYLWSFSVITYSLYYLLLELASFKKEMQSIFKNIAEPVKQLLRYGLPRTVGDFLLFSFAAYPLIAINHRFDTTVAGLFSVAIAINTMITPLFSFMGTILLPRTSASYATNNIKPMLRIINKIALGYVLLALAMAIIITCFSPVIIRIFFDNNFLEASPMCIIISWALIPNAIYLLLRNPLDALSVFPHNTFNLLVSFVVLAVGMHYADTAKTFCGVYLLSYVVIAIMSCISWTVCKKRLAERI
jgi:O-antigen/teichoic acid export membrane protein